MKHLATLLREKRARLGIDDATADALCAALQFPGGHAYPAPSAKNRRHYAESESREGLEMNALRRAYAAALADVEAKQELPREPEPPNRCARVRESESRYTVLMDNAPLFEVKIGGALLVLGACSWWSPELVAYAAALSLHLSALQKRAGDLAQNAAIEKALLLDEVTDAKDAFDKASYDLERAEGHLQRAADIRDTRREAKDKAAEALVEARRKAGSL